VFGCELRVSGDFVHDWVVVEIHHALSFAPEWEGSQCDLGRRRAFREDLKGEGDMGLWLQLRIK
jgi:hypothetical protein